MSDNEEGEEPSSRGNEWEVVSLTASAYAAAPGSEGVQLNDGDKANAFEEAEAETSSAMFMSRHFVFPPSQHENLPVETDDIEIQKKHETEDDVYEPDTEESGRSDGKDKEELDIKGADEFPGIELADDKEDRMSIHDAPQSPKLTEEEIYDGSGLPCEAWWKRGAASLYAHAKEANALWSVFIAAAVMGLVILGQRWQQERWQVLQLKWQFTIGDEKMGRVMGPISRLKDVIVGGHRRGSFIRGSASGEH